MHRQRHRQAVVDSSSGGPPAGGGVIDAAIYGPLRIPIVPARPARNSSKSAAPICVETSIDVAQ